MGVSPRTGGPRLRRLTAAYVVRNDFLLIFAKLAFAELACFRHPECCSVGNAQNAAELCSFYERHRRN